MEMFDTENCNVPYLIKEEASERYVNIAKMTYFREVTATVLTKEEYDLRLKEIVQSKCTGCVSYTEDSEGDNLSGHRGKISLDGKCYWYTIREGNLQWFEMPFSPITSRYSLGI